MSQPQAHEQAARQAVALWGPHGAVCMKAVIFVDPEDCTIVREYQVGYRAADADVTHFVCLGRGPTWEAAFAAARSFRPRAVPQPTTTTERSVR